MSSITAILSRTLHHHVVGAKLLSKYETPFNDCNHTIVKAKIRCHSDFRYFIACLYNNSDIYLKFISEEHYRELSPKWIYTVLHKDGKVIGIDII